MSFICLSAFAACLFQPFQEPNAAAQESTAIILDGEFEDWMARPVTIVDPPDASNAFIDFGEVRIVHDGRFVHLQADFGKTVNAQGLEGTAMLVLNADGDPKTGKTEHGLEGADIILDLSPRGAKSFRHEGVGLRSTTYQPDPNDPAKPLLNPYDIGFAFAPTHAGRRFEFHFDRGAKLPNTPPLFSGGQFTGKLVFIDANGTLADATPIFAHKLTPIMADQFSFTFDEIDPLPKEDHRETRLVSWNIQRGAIFKNPELFFRILRALQPDILHLQELSEHNSAEQLEKFLQTVASAEEGRSCKWHVIFGEGGGDLRCAIASRFALHLSPPLAIVSMPEQPDRTVRTVGAVANINGHSILLVSAHLKCCGSAGGPEDEQRIAEVQAIHAAVKSALADAGDAVVGGQPIRGVVISGDFNLVGARDPLEAFATNLDVDHSSMAIPQTYQLDGLSNATWSDPLQPFTPGRLDYLLVSDSSLVVKRAFVFDTRDLAPRWLQQYSLQQADTATASDHLPIVADLQFKSH